MNTSGNLEYIVKVLENELAVSRASEQRYRRIFETSTVSIWEMDISNVRNIFLKMEIGNWPENISTDSTEVLEMIRIVTGNIRFVDVNEWTLQLFNASSKEDLFENFRKIIGPDSIPFLINFCKAIATGEKSFYSETVVYTLNGKPIPVIFSTYLHSGDFNYEHIIFAIFDISKRKEAQDLLEKSEERLKTVLKTIPDMIILYDREGFFLDYFSGLESNLNLLKSSLVGIHLSDVYSEQTTHLFMEAIQRCLDFKEIQKIEYEVIIDEDVHYFESRIVPAGEHEVLTLAIDITVRKSAELLLQKSEQQYRVLFESANDAILIIDPETENIITANTKASEIYGFSLSELTEMSLQNLTKDIEKGRDKVHEVLQQKSFKNFESTHYNKNGDEINLLVNGSLIEFEGRKAILIINHDITDIKRAEKVKHATYRISELAITSQNLEELYQSIHQIIGELMPARNFYISVYDKEKDILSFPYFVDEHDEPTPPGKPGKGLTEYVLRSGKPLLTRPEIMRKLIEEKEVEIIGTLTFEWMGVPLKIKDRTIGVLVVQSYNESIKYTDNDQDMLIFVSEQVAMAIDRKRKEEELVNAKIMAETSSKIKSALLTNMSHEFRTPMNGILGYAKTLNEKLADQELKNMAGTILFSGKRLMETLDSILYLAEIETSSMQLNVKKLYIGKEIENTLTFFENEAKAKGINFIRDIDQSIVIFNDSGLLNQVIKYLLDNAVKFTLQGSVTVCIKKEIQNEKLMAVIEIKDTGIGISKEFQSIIFDEFRQLSSGYGRTHEGFGLGLTLAQKMVELMNGKIGIYSEPQEGSTFFVRFNLTDQVDFVNGSGVEDKGVNESTKNTNGKLRNPGEMPEVLIVEDNQVNMELTVMFLKNICKTDRAKDGLSAIQLANSKQYDLILMDINLGPGMNGLEAATEIRKIKGYDNIPIIAVTGYTMSGDREKMLEGGCTHYLPKPFDKKSIVNMVTEVLEIK